MTTAKDLVINEWYKGIAESPHLGFGLMRNMNISSTPGVIYPNLATSKKSGTTVTNLVKWFVTDTANAIIYALDAASNVYSSNSGGQSWTLINGNTTTSGDGDGLAVWKDYLFVARNTKVDVYGPLSGSPSWSNDWKTLTANGTSESTAFHPMLVGQDDTLYIGNKRYIASLAENTGQTFAPATAGSYTYNTQALDIPSDYRVKCLAELGVNLMIGTTKGDSLVDSRVADIFPWDRTSSSFGLPIHIDNFGVHAMINVNNLLYIFSGIDGSIYVSNGTSTRLLRRIPEDIIKFPTRYIYIYPGAVITHNEKIYFGLSSTSSGGALREIFGVWSITPSGTLNLEHQISTGTTSFTNPARIGALYPAAAGTYGLYHIGWRDDATYGIDESGLFDGFTGYVASAQSALYRVGSPLAPTQFQEIDFIFDKPLASGDGIRIKYRDNLNAAFETLGTYDFSTEAAVDNFNKSFPNDGFVNLQFQIELNQNARLRELRIR